MSGLRVTANVALRLDTFIANPGLTMVDVATGGKVIFARPCVFHIENP
jgi:hypothetical protein